MKWSAIFSLVVVASCLHMKPATAADRFVNGEIYGEAVEVIGRGSYEGLMGVTIYLCHAEWCRADFENATLSHTDAEGKYGFKHLSPGFYKLRFEAELHTPSPPGDDEVELGFNKPLKVRNPEIRMERKEVLDR